ncbi:hypothetical protein R5R35_011047 [Gryllus longicercus]|uniref:Protein SET n=1 Tax=Gryllus longicercus TaxID=2509291 RepID=A0AAN9Z0R5_9ORTH
MSESGATPKKVKKVEGTSAFGDNGRDYDAETQKALQDIDNCQNKIDALNEKGSEAILKVEQRYNKQRKPHFDKRNDVIKKIPNFWATAFVNHPQMSTILGEDEEDCLHYLSKLEVEDFEDIKSGYRITLYFDENPYFENDVVTKEFHLGVSSDPFALSTPIRWKEGNDVAKKFRNKNAGKGRKRMIEQKSFFIWLASNCDPYTDCIAEVIKDDLWVNPLQYYLVPDEIGKESEGEDVTTDEEVYHSLLAKDEVEEEEDNEGEGGDDEVLVEEDEEEGKELGEDDVDGSDK